MNYFSSESVPDQGWSAMDDTHSRAVALTTGEHRMDVDDAAAIVTRTKKTATVTSLKKIGAGAGGQPLPTAVYKQK
jgi:hypothetical protein